MPVESAADRLSFLDVDEFGVEATYTPAGEAASPAFRGIFDRPHSYVQIEDIPTADARPTFHCRSEDLPADASGGDAGDTLSIDSVVYPVIDLQPDGTGMTLVTLGKGA